MFKGGCDEKPGPHYDLDRVKCAFQTGNYVTPNRVKRHIAARGWSDATVRQVMGCLRSTDLHKSQSHRDRPGVWLDIYRPAFEFERLYLKFALHEDGHSFILLSFCRDGEAH